MKKWMKITLSSLLATALMLTCVCFAGATPQKAVSINAGYATNVKDYGAKGDGTTNDAAAVKAAAEAAVAKSGEGSLYFPAGTYRMADAVSFGSSLEVIFEPGAKLYLEKTASVSAYIVAGDQIIFDGPGSVAGAPTNASGNPVWFGAKGDGVTDDTKAFKTAMQMYRNVDIPYREAGYVVSDLTIAGDSRITGPSADKKAKLIAKADTGNLFTISSSRIYVSNIALEMSASKYGTGIFFNNTGGISHCAILNVDINGAYNAIRDSDNPESNEKQIFITNIKMSGIRCTAGRNTAIEMNDMWGFIFLLDTVVDYTATEGDTTNYPAIYLKDNAGFVGTNVQVIGKGKEAGEKNDGWYLYNSVAVWFDRCTVKDVGGIGFNSAKGGAYIYLLNCAAENAGKYGLQMAGGVDLQTEGFVVKGAGMDGIYLNNCTLAQLHDTTISGCGRNGVLSNAKLVQFVNLKADNNGNYAVSDMGKNNSYTNLTGEGNGKGLSLVEDGQVIIVDAP